MESEIKTLLDRLTDIRSQMDVLRLDKETAIKEMLSPEIRQAIADIEAEFDEKVTAAQANASEVESELKAAALQYGATVKSTRLQAVYVASKASWNTAALDGYAMSHPELLAFRKESEPSVQIRVVK